MPNEEIGFAEFMANVSPAHAGFVNETHEFMLNQGCTVKIEAAKSGHVVSYVYARTKRVVANYVFRKSGLVIRIYGDNIAKYEDILGELPDGIVKSIEKAPVCRRLIDITKCNPRCSMGYEFTLNGAEHKKCRYGSFMFYVIEENYSVILEFLKRELTERAA